MTAACLRFLIVATLLIVSTSPRLLPAQDTDAPSLFATKCGTCHTATPEAGNRAPTPNALRERSPESIVNALTGGAMRYQGLSLNGAERRLLAEFITGRKFGSNLTVPPEARCSTLPAMRDPVSVPAWNGWGPGVENTHFQSAAQARLTVEQVPRLKLKWAFGFPDVTAAWAQPTVVGERLYVGSQNGSVYALDARSGCVIWTFNAEGGVRASITIGSGNVAYFSDQKGYAYALDASTGALRWKRLVEKHPLIRLTGSPVLHEGRLYVPTSSYEEVGKGPEYACCTFRGSIVALDAATGAEIWKAYTIAEEPRVMGKNNSGVDSLGPSGGAIWSAPTIDAGRGLIYAATGNTYSGMSQPTADAIVAFDLKTGSLRWSRQLHPDDVYGCRNNEPNCRTSQGPDFDFGASAALVRQSNGRTLLIAGQKSGIGYALDPDKEGEILWQYRAGRGSTLGGIEWGIAADQDHAYFPVADANSRPAGGLHAVSLSTGERAWFTPSPSPLNCGDPSRTCNGAQSAAITVIPGVVFSGSFDGAIRAYSTSDGSVLWTFDTNREFPTVNKVPARGGSINGPATVVVGGMIYVSSGDYRSNVGNVLLAFGVE